MGAIALTWTLVKGTGSLLWALAKLMLGAMRLLIGVLDRPVGRRISGRSAVRVRRQWNDYRIGVVRWSDLRDPRWGSVSGGMQARSPQPFIHGYVMCNKVRGDIAHSCAHGPGPHNIKVCLVKKDNSKEVWNRVLKLAGPKPAKRFW